MGAEVAGVESGGFPACGRGGDRNLHVPQRGVVDAVAAVVLDRISDHEVVPQGARRLPTAGEGGRPRQATHGGGCRRGARTDAGLAAVSVCAHGEGAAGGSGRAEGGHGALRQRANAPDAFGVDLRRPVSRRPDPARVVWRAGHLRAWAGAGDPARPRAGADARTRAAAEGSADGHGEGI